MNSKDNKMIISVKERADRSGSKVLRSLLTVLTEISLAVSVLLFSGCSIVFEGFEIESVYTQAEDYQLSIYCFDVGSASSILICSDEFNILIDCGQEKAQCDVKNQMELLSVDKLDLVVLTHPDKDHIGNMAEVIDEIEVDRFITCENDDDYEPTKTYEELLCELSDENINIEYAYCGEELNFGELNLKVVSPVQVYDKTNNNSVAMRLSYKDFSMFLSGDMEKKAEKDVLENGEYLESDVLYVAHHGSSSSTTREFLSAVDPNDAIISVSQSEYLPSDQTLARLVDYGCDIFRTDEMGTIVVTTDGNGYTILTDKGEI